MRCIAHANVLLPLLSTDHPHHRVAWEWWEERRDGEVGLCMPVRMALLRLLSNAKVMGSSVLKPDAAWSVVGALAEHPRVAAVQGLPASHDERWHDNVKGRAPSPDLWTDAWLAALAQALGCELVTFDRGFRSFRNLRIVLLRA